MYLHNATFSLLVSKPYKVKTIHDRLQGNAHPIQLPIGAESEYFFIFYFLDYLFHFSSR